MGAAGLSMALMAPLGIATAADGATGRAVADVGWVTGVVLDANGDPVKGDLVNAIGPREVPEAGIIAEQTDRRTWTDENGEFRVRQASPHGYLIQICDPEPQDRTVCRETAQGVEHMITYAGPVGVTDSWVTQTSLFASGSADRKLGAITVKPQGFVHGRIAGAEFQLIQIMRLNGTVAFNNRTDGSGNYRFQGIAPGAYRIQTGGQGTGFLRWRSAVITIEADKDITVNAALDRGADIHGVLRSKGKPVSFTDILVSRHGDFVAAATTDHNGAYTVPGLTPGTYRVGIQYDGSEFTRHAVTVVVPEPHSSVSKDIAVTKGAVITLRLTAGGAPATRAVDELRDGTGAPILGHRNEGGTVTYPGLAPGLYTIVAANDTHYTLTKVRVSAIKTYDLGTRKLAQPTITLTGTSAPDAVVEAKTGQECPPDEPPAFGVFQFLTKADEQGHYTLSGLVPGRYMLGSDGWPNNWVPRCIPDVSIFQSKSRDIRLSEGSVASGRLVYASTGTPVITTLAYQLTYPHGLYTNPPVEHQARDRTSGASGLFSIDRLAAGTVSGALALFAKDDELGSPKFLVIHPFQDGTPYYLSSRPRSIDIPAQSQVKLGNIPLYLHGETQG